MREPRANEAEFDIDVEEETTELKELRASLRRSPPELPSKYLYDEAGAALFEHITELPEYYPTAVERELLFAHGRELLGGGRVDEVIELGSGAALKTVPLLERLVEERRVMGARYIAVDISRRALERTRQIVRGRPGLEGLEVYGLLGDYTRALPLPNRRGGGSRMVLFLGGTLGNETNASAVKLLSAVRAHLQEGDLLLLGVNTPAPAPVIERAYNDPAGVTATFNLNVLRAVNRLTGSRFDPGAFEHLARYVEARQQLEMWLVARRALVVDLGRMGGALRLGGGQGIRTEISRRFLASDVSLLMSWSGFGLVNWMPSHCGRFALALGRARRMLH